MNLQVGLTCSAIHTKIRRVRVKHGYGRTDDDGRTDGRMATDGR